MKRCKKPKKLEIDYSLLTPVQEIDTLVLTDEALKQYKLDVDKTKIDNFDEINFVSIFEE